MAQCGMRLAYPEPELSSGPIRIRRWNHDDLACVRAASSDPDIPKGTTVPARFTEDAGRAFIERQWSRNDDGQALTMAIAKADSNEAVGQIYLSLTKVDRQCRLGYWVVPAERGRGLGSAAVRLVSRWLLTETDVYRLVAEVHPDNVASIGLLDGCGFALEGTPRSWLWIDGQPHDALQYSIIRPDVVGE